MKRKIGMILLCAAALCLAGCAAATPAAAEDGTPWSKDWITLGQTLGVEPPGNGLTLRDNKTSTRGMYYAAWSAGEAQPYTNAEGQETSLYDGQLVLLLSDAQSPEGAQASVEEWLDLASDSYTVTGTAQQTYNGRTFTVLTYTFPPESSSFARGVSAFTSFDHWAVSVEFVGREAFSGDMEAILADFLSHCHYAAAGGGA